MLPAKALGTSESPQPPSSILRVNGDTFSYDFTHEGEFPGISSHAVYGGSAFATAVDQSGQLTIRTHIFGHRGFSRNDVELETLIDVHPDAHGHLGYTCKGSSGRSDGVVESKILFQATGAGTKTLAIQVGASWAIKNSTPVSADLGTFVFTCTPHDESTAQISRSNPDTLPQTSDDRFYFGLAVVLLIIFAIGYWGQSKYSSKLFASTAIAAAFALSMVTLLLLHGFFSIQLEKASHAKAASNESAALSKAATQGLPTKVP